MTAPDVLTDLRAARSFKTMAEQVAVLHEYSNNPLQRIRTGFDQIDVLIEGPAKGEVCTFIGPSYSGKSIIAQNIMWRNADKPAIFFSLEMPAILALQRLYAMHANIPNADVHVMTAEGRLPPDLDEMPEHFNNHIIIDKGALGPGDMMRYVDQFEAVFGIRPMFICVDYLELIDGAKTSGEGWMGTEKVAQEMKDMAKEADIPIFLLHQTNRTTSPPWLPPTMNSARGGGFTEADQIVGMWRPHLNPKLDEYEKQMLENEVHFTVLKNRAFGRHNRKPIEMVMTESLRLVDRRY